MTGLPAYVAWCLAGLVLCLALLILRRPVVRLFRLALRSGVGLGVNLVNALVLGLLGLPGFGLLLMLQWVLRT